MELSDKTFVVTGANTGLGKATVEALAARGARRIIVASRSRDKTQPVLDALVARSPKTDVQFVALDLGDLASVRRAADEILSKDLAIDVLVNNAGIAPVAPRLLDVTEALFDKTMAVNLKGPLRLAARAAEVMQPGSTIVNISSVASVRPNSLTAVYAAAKAGLNVLTSVMAQEFAPKGIRVNAIVCGTFWTDSFRAGVPNDAAVGVASRGNVLRRIARPEEIVGTALYLASDASSYTTGQLIQVDGGVLP
jgi:NAD(P)-dependent dehydrogenase (short-subunit alcohol dehydrogenase family)